MRLTDILYHAWVHPFTTKCDFARTWADMVAMAASDGLITTRTATGLYQNKWHITQRGLKHLEMMTGEPSE